MPGMIPRAGRLQTTALILLAWALMNSGTGMALEAWEHQDPEVVLEGAGFASDLEPGRDGYLYYSLLQELEVHRLDLETLERDEDFVVEFPEAHWESGTETGLLSIALAPDFHASGVFYASYTTLDDEEWTNVLARVTLMDETGTAEHEVLLTRPGLEFHNGGRVMVADDHLWWTTGDAQHYMDPLEDAFIAQEDGNLIGKVLRLDLDGGPAPGNPWDDHAYTKGHRNVFGIAWDGENERAFITENAAQESDYVQILEAGANYGWPECEGFCDEPHDEYTDPVWQGEDGTIAPTGATWFRGAFWWGTYNMGQLHRTHEQNGNWTTEVAYSYPGTDEDRPVIVGVTTGPDTRSIWFTTLNEIVRLQFDEHDDHPETAEWEDPPYWWDRDEDDDAVEEQDPEEEPTPALGPLVVALVFFGLLALLGHRRPR
jgi:hypothetical protein